MPLCPPSAGAILVFVSAVNMFNYIDRGVVMGAPIQFGEFIERTMHSPADHQSLWLGTVTSSFIACYSVACITFGHLVHTVPRFRLLCGGLLVWVVAIACSGFGYFLGDRPATFYLFLLARACSGVGEAAFQCIVPPYIDDFSPDGAKALWLGAFYMAIPVGTSIGFGYGAAMASGPGWGYAYLLEAILMLPCALAMAWLPTSDALIARREAARHSRRAPPLLESLQPPVADEGAAPFAPNGPLDSASLSGVKPLVANGHANSHAPPGTAGAAGADGTANGVGVDGGGAAGGTTSSAGSAEVHTLASQVKWLLTSPVFVGLAMGYAAYSATAMGISSFGPLFLVGLDLFPNETAASTTFAAICAVGGIVGTPLGAKFSDHVVRKTLAREEASSGSRPGPELINLVEARAQLSSMLRMVCVGVGSLTCSVLCFYLGPVPHTRYAFLFFFIIGFAASAGTCAGMTRTIMLIVPTAVRPFALAVNTLLLHGFGDVPSPPIVGLLISAWAPTCHTVMSNTSHPRPVLDPDCAVPIEHPGGPPTFNPDQLGLIAVCVVTTLYMGTAIGWWCMAFVGIRLREARARRSASWAESIAGSMGNGGAVSDGPSRETGSIND